MVNNIIDIFLEIRNLKEKRKEKCRSKQQLCHLDLMKKRMKKKKKKKLVGYDMLIFFISDDNSALTFVFCCLNFSVDIPIKKKKLGKNPDVDTSFLPDREREV